MKREMRGINLSSQRERGHWLENDYPTIFEYFDKERVYTEYITTTAQNLNENSIYLYNSSTQLRCPKNIIKDKINFRSDNTTDVHFSRQMKFRMMKTEEASPCIVFKMSQQTIWQAIYYLEKKSLVFTPLLYKEFINNTLKWLAEREYLKPLLKTTTVQNGVNVVEIHEGVPEIVFMPEKSIIVTVGCDPEFEVVRNGIVIQPPSIYDGVGPDCKLGRDGSGCQIEIRPSPSTDTIKVIEDMTKILKKVKDPISVLGHVHPLGGHVHLGVGGRVTPTQDLLFLLDYFMGNESMNLSGEARGGYKRKSAYESKPWGFEYRTPSACIFHNPDFAELGLRICKNVTEAYVNCQKMKITVPTPTLEDYMNYCNFTKEDYERWTQHLSAYKTYLNSSRTSYKFNIAHNWVPEAPDNTTFGSTRCRYADSSGKCDNPECGICYPETAERARAERILRERRTRQERERMATERRAMLGDTQSCTDMLRQFNIAVNDDWTANALREVIRVLRENNVQRFRNELYLFGLRENRGNVTCGFTISNYERIRLPDYVRRSYGVPRIIRVGTRLGDIPEVVRAIIAENNDNIIFQPTTPTVATPQTSAVQTSTPEEILNRVLETGQPTETIESMFEEVF